MRTLYLVHQNAHWETKGSNFYSDHLMYERVYKSDADDADALAERIVGQYGVQSLNFALQGAYMAKCMAHAAQASNVVLRSIAAEEKAMAMISEAYYAINELTLGLDDLLMNISSHREESLYLLKQRNANSNI